MSKRDYYEVIGVSKTATAPEIKKAFRQRARALHPDNKDSGDEKAFKELAEAYEVLSDQQKRARYDQYGHEGVKGSTRSFDDFDFGQFQGFGLDEILEQLFGAGGRSSGFGGFGRQPQNQGASLRYDMELDFLEAVFGCDKKVKVKRLEDCNSCEGSGAAPGSNVTTCQTCGGVGQVKQLVNMLFVQTYQITTCPGCHGQGKQVDKPCRDCRGEGLAKKNKEFDLTIPAGIEDGSKMRLTNAGDKGPHGGPYGDVIVVIHVKPHRDFIREGTTIHVQQPISISMAALGGELLVPTVDGSKLLKIPDGIESGTKLVMRNIGVPHWNNPSRRGDQVVHIFVKTPTKLSREQKELFKKLAELQGERLTLDPDEIKEVLAANKNHEKKGTDGESNNAGDDDAKPANEDGKKKKKDSDHTEKDETLFDKIVDAFRPKNDD